MITFFSPEIKVKFSFHVLVSTCIVPGGGIKLNSLAVVIVIAHSGSLNYTSVTLLLMELTPIVIQNMVSDVAVVCNYFILFYFRYCWLKDHNIHSGPQKSKVGI